MRALVGIKRVIDYAVKVRIKSDKSGVEKAGVKMSMNPFCEIAVEEAVRLKEKNIVSHVTTLSIGDKNTTETLRQSLALGADDSFHIFTTLPIDTIVQPLLVAKVLKLYALKHKFDLVLLGKQSIDDDSNQTAQILSALLSWPIANFASQITKVENGLEVTRETDTGLQKVLINTPCIISCDLRLNTPRYAGIKNITAVQYYLKFKAKKKTIIEEKLESLGLNLEPRFKITEIKEPEKKKGGIKVQDVDDLIRRLRDEAKLL